MPAKDVGDVLRKTHSWLRRGGLLINLQPYAEPMQVEVRIGGERRTVGTARDCDDKQADMRASLCRLAEVVEAGLFALRAESHWRFEMEFPTAEDWREFAEKPSCGGIDADARQLAAVLAQPDGAVIVSDDELAAVYERRGEHDGKR